MDSLDVAAEKYLPRLVAGDADGVLALFGKNEPLIEDPRAGRVAGEQAVRKFVSESKAFWDVGHSNVLHLRTTRSGKRTVSEEILRYQKADWDNGLLELPVGIVTTDGPDQALASVHVYFTNWPFNRHHSIRPAFAIAEPGATHTDIVERYVREGLHSGDVAATVATHAPDMYFREASGPPYVHWGRTQVGKYFKGLFERGAPWLRPNNVTDDGRCSIMEFTVIGWNHKLWPEERHQAGLAVYERSESSGLIRAIRIYDDVDFS